MRLDHLVEPVGSAGRVFAASVQVLILLSVVAFCVETLPDLSPETRSFLHTFELVSVVLFTAEYVLRIIASRPRRKYVLSFFGLVDLVAILPFFVTIATSAFTGVDLRSIRLFRMFRLMRTLKLVRYSAAARRFVDAFQMIRTELALVLVACVFLLFTSAVGIYYFEGEAQPEQFGSIFHCMWWAVSTLTTVGYGDVYPITIGGRLFTAIVLFVGLGIVAVPAGLVAGAVARTLKRDEEAGDAVAAGSVDAGSSSSQESSPDATSAAA